MREQRKLVRDAEKVDFVTDCPRAGGGRGRGRRSGRRRRRSGRGGGRGGRGRWAGGKLSVTRTRDHQTVDPLNFPMNLFAEKFCLKIPLYPEILRWQGLGRVWRLQSRHFKAPGEGPRQARHVVAADLPQNLQRRSLLLATASASPGSNVSNSSISSISSRPPPVVTTQLTNASRRSPARPTTILIHGGQGRKCIRISDALSIPSDRNLT